MMYTTDRDIYRHCDIPDPVLFLENNGWTCIGVNRAGERIWKTFDGWKMKAGKKVRAYKVKTEYEAVAYEVHLAERNNW